MSLLPSAGPQRPEKRPQILGEQLWFFECGEMTAARELRVPLVCERAAAVAAGYRE
jgi:hypothetical protein